MSKEINSSQLIELISGRRTIYQFKEGMRPRDKLMEAIAREMGTKPSLNRAMAFLFVG